MLREHSRNEVTKLVLEIRISKETWSLGGIWLKDIKERGNTIRWPAFLTTTGWGELIKCKKSQYKLFRPFPQHDYSISLLSHAICFSPHSPQFLTALPTHRSWVWLGWCWNLWPEPLIHVKFHLLSCISYCFSSSHQQYWEESCSSYCFSSSHQQYLEYSCSISPVTCTMRKKSFSSYLLFAHYS